MTAAPLRTAALPLLLVLLSVSALRAQRTTAGLPPGARVRFLTPTTGQVVGSLSALRTDTVFVVAEGRESGRLYAVPTASLTYLQVSRGWEPWPVSVLRGGAVGFALGAVLGAAASVIGGETAGRRECGPPAEDDICFTLFDLVIIGAALGAPAGAAGGAVHELRSREERWRTVPLPPGAAPEPRAHP